MNKKEKNVGVILRTVQTFVIVCFLALLWQVCKKFDGYFFPVIVNAELISVETTENGYVNTEIAYKKIRQCDHIRTDWFIGRPGQALLTTSERVSTPNRVIAKGESGISNTIIRMSEVNLLQNSFAITVHDCYSGWLWDTETVYWYRTSSP